MGAVGFKSSIASLAVTEAPASAVGVAEPRAASPPVQPDSPQKAQRSWSEQPGDASFGHAAHGVADAPHASSPGAHDHNEVVDSPGDEPGSSSSSSAAGPVSSEPGAPAVALVPPHTVHSDAQPGDSTHSAPGAPQENKERAPDEKEDNDVPPAVARLFTPPHAHDMEVGSDPETGALSDEDDDFSEPDELEDDDESSDAAGPLAVASASSVSSARSDEWDERRAKASLRNQRRDSDPGKTFRAQPIQAWDPFGEAMGDPLLDEELEDVDASAAVLVPTVGKVEADLARTMNVLSTKTFPFPRRLAALEHIRHILGDAAQVAALRDAAEWRQLRKDLVVSLALQITDLRSNVVRRSSLALGELCALCQGDEEFAAAFAGVLPQLCSRLKLSIVVLAKVADKCILSCLRRLKSIVPLEKLMLLAIKDKHREVRFRCTEYCTRLTLSAKPKDLEPYMDALCNCVCVNEKDADGDVRRSARQLYMAVKSQFPDRGPGLMAKFSKASNFLLKPGKDYLGQPVKSPLPIERKHRGRSRSRSRSSSKDLARSHSHSPRRLKLHPSRRHPSFVDEATQGHRRMRSSSSTKKRAFAGRIRKSTGIAPPPPRPQLDDDDKTELEPMKVEVMEDWEWEEVSRGRGQSHAR